MENISLSLAITSIGAGILAVAAAPRAVDYGGLTMVITAVGIAIPSVTAAILSIVSVVLAQRNRNDNLVLQEDVAVIKTDVRKVEIATNSMKDALVLAQGKLEFAKGEKQGMEDERADPKISATIVDETVLTKESELTEAKKAELKAKADDAKKPEPKPKGKRPRNLTWGPSKKKG